MNRVVRARLCHGEKTTVEKPTYLQRANSKLCFLLHKNFFASENSLPARGMKTPPKSALLDRRLRHERIAIFSDRRGESLTLKISIMEKNRPTSKGRGGRPAKDNPAIYRFSVNFSAEEHARFLTMYEQSGAVVESRFCQGAGFRRCLPRDKNRPRNAGIRSPTDATARPISGDRRFKAIIRFAYLLFDNHFSRFSSHAIFCPRFFMFATASASFIASPGRRP